MKELWKWTNILLSYERKISLVFFYSQCWCTSLIFHVHKSFSYNILILYNFVCCRGLNKQGYKCQSMGTFCYYFCVIYIAKSVRVTSFCLRIDNCTYLHFKDQKHTHVDGRIVWCFSRMECFVLVAVCNCAVHKKCHDKILGKCTGSAKDSRETKVTIRYLLSDMLFSSKWVSYTLSVFTLWSKLRNLAEQMSPLIIK